MVSKEYQQLSVSKAFTNHYDATIDTFVIRYCGPIDVDNWRWGWSDVGEAPIISSELRRSNTVVRSLQMLSLSFRIGR